MRKYCANALPSPLNAVFLYYLEMFSYALGPWCACRWFLFLNLQSFQEFIPRLWNLLTSNLPSPMASASQKTLCSPCFCGKSTIGLSVSMSPHFWLPEGKRECCLIRVAKACVFWKLQLNYILVRTGFYTVIFYPPCGSLGTYLDICLNSNGRNSI